MITSVKNRDIFKIEEEATKQIYYGSNQEWYKKRWQRLSGCGPSAVANVIHYHNRTHNAEQQIKLSKDDYLELMNDIWDYVTPSINGVSSTAMLCKGVHKYMIEKKLDIKLDFIDVPKKKEQRPDFKQVISFLEEALKRDTPVPFLNLEHGTVVELDSWHWVTIISMEYEPDGSSAYVEILDQGLINRIDLHRWYQSTKLGGGFVSFLFAE